MEGFHYCYSGGDNNVGNSDGNSSRCSFSSSSRRGFAVVIVGVLTEVPTVKMIARGVAAVIVRELGTIMLLVTAVMGIEAARGTAEGEGRARECSAGRGNEAGRRQVGLAVERKAETETETDARRGEERRLHADF